MAVASAARGSFIGWSSHLKKRQANYKPSSRPAFARVGCKWLSFTISNGGERALAQTTSLYMNPGFALADTAYRKTGYAKRFCECRNCRTGFFPNLPDLLL